MAITRAGEGFDDFLNAAEGNVRRSTDAFPEYRARLERIHDAYGILVDGLYNTRESLIVMFVLRAHSAFLGSCRLALASQTVESYVTNRACLEAAIYGVYLHRHPDKIPIWRDRHNDAASLQACRDTFQIGPMIKFLTESDRRVGERIAKIYGWAIDLGAHPNERALLSTTRTSEVDGMVDLRMHYLIAEYPIIEAALKTTARAGLCALDVFRNVFPKRFELIGLDDRMRALRQGL
jgi:hypothetical protein